MISQSTFAPSAGPVVTPATPAESDAMGAILSPARIAATPPAAPATPARTNTPADRLPPGIGNSLRAAAASGDAAAEFEVATRLAEGRGVPPIWPKPRPGSSAPPTRAWRRRNSALAASTKKARGSRRTSTPRGASTWPPPMRATPRRCTTSRCCLPRVSTASPTTPPRRAGSARPPTMASPTASTIWRSCTPAASASKPTWRKPSSGSRSPPRGRPGRRQEARRRGGRLDNSHSRRRWRLRSPAGAAAAPGGDRGAGPPGGWDGAAAPSAAKRTVGPKADNKHRAVLHNKSSPAGVFARRKPLQLRARLSARPRISEDPVYRRLSGFPLARRIGRRHKGKSRCAGLRPSHRPGSNRRIRTRADLPSDRRPAGQYVRHPGHGAGGRIHLRHVRRRRRLPDDAAADLHRHPAGGRGRDRGQPYRRHVVLRARWPIGGGARWIQRSRSCCYPAAWSAPPAACWLFNRLRAIGQLDITIGLSYVDPARRGRRADDRGERARHQPRAPRPADRAAPSRQPRLVPRPAAEIPLQALEDLRLGDPGRGDRLPGRVRRRPSSASAAASWWCRR